MTVPHRYRSTTRPWYARWYISAPGLLVLAVAGGAMGAWLALSTLGWWLGRG